MAFPLDDHLIDDFGIISNNLLYKICCESIVDITFFSKITIILFGT